MAENKKISQLNPAVAFTGAEKFEILQGGLNLYGTPEQMKEYVGAGPTREFNRAFSSELLFDKNEIDYATHTQTDEIVFSVAPAGHLTDQFSTAIHTIVADGVNPISFTGYNFIYGIQSGAIPDAGTYQVFFMYRNGVSSAHWAEPSFEEANLTTLGTPGSFAAVADGENEIDLSWAAVTNASSYEIQFSATGGSGPWIALTNPGSGDTSYTHSGLSAGTTYHYRIRAVGDGENFANSNWATTAGTTEDAGDSDAPVATPSISDTATGIPINQSLVWSFNEAIRNTDGSEITNANVASICVLKQTDSGGSNIPFTATINTAKTQITVVPNVIYGSEQLVYAAVNNFEDVNGNEETTPQSITFTTSDYTLNIGNYLNLGQQLNAFITGNDVRFKIRQTVKNQVLVGQRFWMDKHESGQRSWGWGTENTDSTFSFYHDPTPAQFRRIRWGGVISDAEAEWEVRYDGTIDTNDGLDRLSLYKDGVLQGSKAMDAVFGIWPFPIFSGTADLKIGPSAAEVKDVMILDWDDNVLLNIPIVRTGIDISGNDRHGTWV